MQDKNNEHMSIVKDIKVKISPDSIEITWEFDFDYNLTKINVTYNGMPNIFDIQGKISLYKTNSIPFYPNTKYSICLLPHNGRTLIDRYCIYKMTDFPLPIIDNSSVECSKININIKNIVTTAENLLYLYKYENTTNIPEDIKWSEKSHLFEQVINLTKKEQHVMFVNKDHEVAIVLKRTYGNDIHYKFLYRFEPKKCAIAFNNFKYITAAIPLVIILCCIIYIYKLKKTTIAISPDTFVMTDVVHDIYYKKFNNEELNDFLLSHDASSFIILEHTNIPQPKSVFVGSKYPKKNRYVNVLPNVNTVVKLTGDSEYINANYIKDYKDENMYIATQGPLKTTFTDFWRMVWQESASIIVMLTNLVENDKAKCEKYWPEERTAKKYGYIKVYCKKSVKYLDFEVRTFNLTLGEDVKDVVQYHFTTWPDNSVPIRPPSLVNFLRKIISVQTFPIVVHCSAGIGRTGAFILSHSAFTMAKEIKKVDFPLLLMKLRSCRSCMIKEKLQYQLCYCVVNELINSSPSEILEVDLNPQLSERQHLIHSKAIVDNHDYWLDILGRYINPSYQNNIDKNRSKHVFKSHLYFIYLERNIDESLGDYINAVRIESRLICAQQPLPTTICDFWRLVDETKASLIYSLHNIESKNDCPYFWPTKTEHKLKPTTYIEISLLSESDNEIYSVKQLKLMNKRNKSSRSIQLVEVKCWPRDTLPTVTNFQKVYKHFISNARKSKILLTCSDGATGCGIFLTCFYVHLKLMQEKVYDVCYVARALRFHRDDFMRNLEHYMFVFVATRNQLLVDEEERNDAASMGDYTNLLSLSMYENV
ncbi:PREDICTED: receptor-type tyrosine-protein phosphatase alpha-like [Nicrophorus vespilloides]|uniref:protein-tyrosine-phosphatase n=1 Tax=Nicrophorus vespilloides TaxID=110193 RepID=A0ABM1MPC7_NICVS|nr:PREDICTED: receptor-type tyrosine-protein phosphatase alpha-like [Nicrophorus vespilloides]